MTRLLLFLALVLTASTAHAQTWEFLNPRTTGNAFNSIEQIGPDTYYLVGEYGLFARTTDGGQTFSVRPRFPSTAGATLSFISASTGWVATADGKIFRTTDAGDSWTQQYQSPGTFAFVGVSMVDGQNGWAAARQGFSDRLVVRTTDGGATWTTVNYPRSPGASFEGPFYVRGFDANTAVVADYSNNVYRTTDGGATWEATLVQALSPAGYFEGGFFLDANRGWLVGPNQTISATTDGGRTWTRQLGSADSTNEARTYMTEAHFADAQTGWATSFGCLYRTQNGGQTWTSACNAVRPSRDNDVFLGTDGVGFVLEPGALLKSTDGGTTFADLTPGYKQFIAAAEPLDASGRTAVAVTGDNGAALRTTDGWQTFSIVPTGATALNDLDFAGSMAGWAVGPAGAIRATTDGGATWTAQTSGTTRTLSGVAALGLTSAVAVGLNATVLKTTDGGTTWTPRSVGGNDNLRGVHFLDDRRGWVVGDTGFVATTADGGETWAPQTSSVLTNLNRVFFLDAQRGWIARSGSGGILYTTNGGTTWTPAVVPPSVTSINRLFFLDADRGWAAAFRNVLRTTDGGRTWTLDPANVSGNVHSDLYFADAENGWLFGSNGTILRYSGQATAAEANAAAEASPLRVFPNPSAGAATLALTLGAPAEVTLTVHDVLGRAIARQRTMLGAGEQRLSLPSGLAPGMYVVVAEASGERLGTARLTVVR